MTTKTLKATRRKTLAVAVLTAAAISMTGVSSMASAVESVTPSGYEQYLTQLIASGDTSASQTLQEFQTLSSADQIEFMGYISDPKRGQELTDAISDTSEVDASSEESFVPTSDTRTFENGDVVLGSTTETTEPVAVIPSSDDEISGPSTTYYDRTVSYKYTEKIHGVMVDWIQVSVHYRYSKSRVTKILSAWAEHKNRIPYLSINHDPLTSWISADPANNANAQAVWRGEWMGSSWTVRERVWGDQRGLVGGYRKSA